MTGFDSKRQAAQAKLDDEADTLTIVYQRGFADGKKAAQRKPLTDEIKTRCPYTAVSERGAFYDGWLSAEAAHNIKEQPAQRWCMKANGCKTECGNCPNFTQPEQEPVAWIAEVELSLFARTPKEKTTVEIWKKPVIESDVAIYTTPPQRPWVGLTDEDRRKFAAAQYGWEDLLIAAEAKLKERNT